MIKLRMMQRFHPPLHSLFKGFISIVLLCPTVRSTRKDYAKGALNKADLPQNPLRLLSQWVEEAAQADPEDYNAMCVATQGLAGGMNGRIVLLRALEGDCLRFFTNYESEKGKELSASPEIACVFFWKELERQVRVRGHATPSSDAACVFCLVLRAKSVRGHPGKASPAKKCN